MKLAMTVDEALDFADEWSRGITLHEGSQGWRVVCMLLAEEVRRMRGELQSIADMTDADNPASYRCDDREGCLDTVFSTATEALTPNASFSRGPSGPSAGSDS